MCKISLSQGGDGLGNCGCKNIMSRSIEISVSVHKETTTLSALGGWNWVELGVGVGVKKSTKKTCHMI